MTFRWGCILVNCRFTSRKYSIEDEVQINAAVPVQVKLAVKSLLKMCEDSSCHNAKMLKLLCSRGYFPPCQVVKVLKLVYIAEKIVSLVKT